MKKMELIPYITSHNLRQEGYGRKTHIGYYEGGKPLCGMRHTQYDTTGVEITTSWILTGLATDELCKKCAEKALKILEQQNQHNERE